jgi:hypothetical protein
MAVVDGWAESDGSSDGSAEIDGSLEIDGADDGSAEVDGFAEIDGAHDGMAEADGEFETEGNAVPSWPSASPIMHAMAKATANVLRVANFIFSILIGEE